jgi:SAM-dependent methyltransferase
MLIFGLGLCTGQGGPLAHWPPRSDFTVLETSGFRGHPVLLAQKFRYVNLLYDSAVGDCIQGDVSRLPLRDETLDAVLTSDVFEHVRDDTAGFREIARALRPGGYFVLQAPAIGELEETRTLVETRDGQDVYLTEPRYHADQTLVYRYYGNDVLSRLDEVGLSALIMRREDAAQVIAEQTIVIAQKAPRVSLGPREASLRAWSYVPEIPAIEPRPAGGRHGPASTITRDEE